MNALYFKGRWTAPFSKENTGKEPFYKENGKKADVDMMKKGTTSLAYRAGNGFRAVSLPYGNETFSMVVLLPDEGKTVADVIAALGALEWTDFLHSMDWSTRVNLWLPKFKTKTKVSLNDILSDMGMARAFTSDADFKALSDNALRLTSVQQDAIIIVDEEGTEAAAVSVGTVGTTSVPPPPVDFHVDRPFLYLITESGTGAILFAGRFGGTEL
jgi:serpin B